jgi:hypothetical protein
VRSLSTSEEGRLHALVEEVGASVTAALAGGPGDCAVPRSDASELLTHAVRLYASQSDGGQRGPSGTELCVTPTEAVTVAAALLRSQQLTPFEFAIWYAEEGHAAGMEAED